MVDEPVVEEQPPQPTKAKGRAKKVEEKGEELHVQPEGTKQTRGRQAKVVNKDEKAEAAVAPKTRGRSKKIAVDEADKSEVVEKQHDIPQPEPVKKTTRARATATKTTSAPKATTKSAKPKIAAVGKKVTFQDDAGKDKENVPIEMEKPAKPATGLRAKPIRRPAATKGTTRGRKAVPQDVPAGKSETAQEVQPLSPKKVMQVAKSSSTSSEDELCGEKTPVRALSQSPVKPPPSSVRMYDKEVSKLDFGTATVPSSPTKTAASVLQSPARRPPLSPFKDAMRSSPKKGNLGTATPNQTFMAPQSPLKSSMRDSPKRGIAPLALSQPVLASKTPLKSALLQSPARRPGGLPMKTFTPHSSSKASIVSPVKAAPLSIRKEENLVDDNSPKEAVASSTLLVRRTLGTASKLHKVNDAAGPVAVGPDTVSKVSPGDVHELGTPSHFSRIDEPETFDEVVDDESSLRSPSPSPVKSIRATSPLKSVPGKGGEEAAATQTSDQRSTTPPGPPAFAAPAFSLASPAFRSGVEESDSEDELNSPQKGFLTTPLKNHNISTHDFGSAVTTKAGVSSRRSSYKSGSKRQSIAMIPLAVQMSAWLASSPEKKSECIGKLDQQVPLSSPRFQESPAKPSFFEDQLAITQAGEDSIVDVEMVDADIPVIAFNGSQESQVSEEYGDENAVPVNVPTTAMEQLPQEDLKVTCTPAKVINTYPREICTVSKVPLRPAGEESPLKVPKKRRKSIAGPIASAEPVPAVTPVGQATTPTKGGGRSKPTSPFKPRSSNDDSLIETPKSLRKRVASEALKGAVVYVDVHTTEGEDASSIFLDLLNQMGARCVKQWSWNPRASVGRHSPNQSDHDNNKVGITHVVFKDGGKRTMEKVRESRGAVFCVGVGWVLE